LSLTLLGSFVGALIGLGLFYLLTIVGWARVATLLLPAVFVGLGACYIGKPYQARYRIIPSVAGVAVYTICVNFLFAFEPLFVILAPLNFVITYHFSKVRMDKREVKSVWQQKINTE